MKTFLKIFSLILVGVAIFLLIPVFFKTGLDYYLITDKIMIIIKGNIISLASIALLCVTLTKEHKSPLAYIVMTYFLLILLLSIYPVFASDIYSEFFQSYFKFYRFFISLQPVALVYALITLIDVNNAVANFFKKASYYTIGFNMIFSIITAFQGWMDTIARNQGLAVNKNIFAAPVGLLDSLYFISIIVLITSIFLLYITNYAFSSDDYIVDENTMDYGNIKEETNKLIQNKMDSLYKPEAKQVVSPVIVPNNDPKLMNINNQLNQNSNVGAVKEQAKEVNVTNTSLNSIFNMSSGPVMNSTPNNNENSSNENKNT